MVDARLRDGSRVNAVIAPVSLRGASLTIRKFPQRRLDMRDLLAVGALDESMAVFLTHCVRHRKNLLVSGGTGSGKTSLLNILSNAIPPGERIITIEDAAELRLNHSHLVSLEARPANLEGRGRVEIRDLVRNALRMRPDRIVVGECRGAEAFDMLAAMNTGHEGSLTTLHANTPRDALGRLETMILMAGMDLPLAAVREHIAASIDLIVQLARAADGRRMVRAVVQVAGIESGRIQLQELFVGQPGPPAVFRGCGLMPEGFPPSAGLDIQLFSQRTVCRGSASLGGGPGASC
jgi:pilus assembly protein CpaF